MAVFVGTPTNDNYTGTTGDDTIDGNDGNDTLNGNGGRDVIHGGNGYDTISASGSGSMIYGDANRDHMTMSGSNGLVDGGADNDQITVGGVGNQVFGGAGDDRVSLYGNSNQVFGGTGDDAITASYIHDTTIDGGAGDDYVNGEFYNCNLYGGDGNDLLAFDMRDATSHVYGGNGNDTYVIQASAQTGQIGTLVENVGEGIDTVRIENYNRPSFYVLGDNFENLTIDGHGVGNGLDNLLTGSLGDDILDGAFGGDTMKGGMGNDTYYVDNTGDGVVELVGEGHDSVFSHISYTLTNNVEDLTLQGNGDYAGTGNALSNIITGNDGNNWLDGKAGADTLYGGIGSDTFIVDNSGDVAVEYGDTGLDTVESSVSYVLGDNIETLLLTGTAISGTGNALDNVVTGNAAANALYGGAGNDIINGEGGGDRMEGGAGDDTFVVDNAGDRVYDNVGGANAGTDLVQSSIDFTLGTWLENLTLSETGAINGTGNGLDNVIAGNDGANSLSGLSGDDSLYGWGGNDTLDGGKGHNALYGGTGNDTFIVDTGDRVIENDGEGHDTVMASVSWSLTGRANFIEDLVLTGSGDINGTGNHLDNVITGNSGDNVLNGGYGHDVLSGGLGADTFVFETGGNDTVSDFSGAQGDHIDTHALTHGDAKDHLIVQSGGDVHINLGYATITILNATAADVAAHMVW